MSQYSMTCSCGHVMSTEAGTREEAVAKLQGDMTEANMKVHMAEKHPGEPVPALDRIHAMIAQHLTPA